MKFHPNTKDDIYFYSLSPYKEYIWMSNFHRCDIDVGGVIWPTVENFFQAQKTHDEDEKEKMRKMLPWNVKKYGRWQVKLREDWEEVKWYFMYYGTMLKYTQNPDLKEKLLATGSARLHEDSPTDKYWGICGKDILGKIIEQVREEIRWETW